MLSKEGPCFITVCGWVGTRVCVRVGMYEILGNNDEISACFFFLKPSKVLMNH